MKVAIIGTRGIPNHYGGFEQFAEFLSIGLIAKGHQVTVYNSSLHPYQEKEWKGVEIIHCKDFEDKLGTAGQFIYDFNCILNARKQDFDILLQLGYTSSSVWGKLLPKNQVIVTNMDGLEWKRSKFSKNVQKFLKKAEEWAINTSDYLVADSIGIKEYLKESRQVESTYIAYGANIFKSPNKEVLKKYKLEEKKYCLLIARMEPENNIETILEGYDKSDNNDPFLVIGKTDNTFGTYLKEKFKKNKSINFLGGIYEIEALDNLRYFANLYFHGHSVGGTNPSLLEAMSSNALIVANNNVFNKSILGEDALYFNTSQEIENIFLQNVELKREEFTQNNIDKITTLFSWGRITNQYENLFLSCLNENNK